MVEQDASEKGIHAMKPSQETCLYGIERCFFGGKKRLVLLDASLFLFADRGRLSFFFQTLPVLCAEKMREEKG